jgi:hypothetical protein
MFVPSESLPEPTTLKVAVPVVAMATNMILMRHLRGQARLERKANCKREGALRRMALANRRSQ